MQDFRQKWTGLAVKMASRDLPSVKLATYKRSLRREPWCPILTSQVAQLSRKSITPVMTWPLVACIDCYSSSLYVKHLSVSLEIPGEILRVTNAISVNLELTWQYPLSKFCSKQARAVCVNWFHPLLSASMAARIITSFTLHWLLTSRDHTHH